MATDARTPDRSRDPIKVSVVIPVHNPGRRIDRLLASLRRQSLPAHEFEVIFVDDASTDGTAARLDAIAAETDNFTVIHIPHSGWPGKPRNVGVDAARGEYVQFVDHDDELGDEALARMWEYARANGSDVVVGKEVRRNRRRRPVATLFQVNRPQAQLGSDPLLAVLTPHKMFRRGFLAEHDIRFPEGPRRLEDHPFVVKAYFRANVISVLSDYACYYWVQHADGSNTGGRPRVWSEWYGYLRDALDVVEEHTDPGPFRDKLLAHWYRGKGLGHLQRTLGHDRPDARAHFDALAHLAAERFPLTVDQHLPPVMRVHSHLLRGGEFELLSRLMRAEQGMRFKRRLERLSVEDGALRFEASAHLLYSNGAPVTVEHVGDRVYWIPPVPLDRAVPAEMLEFSEDLSRSALEVHVQKRSTHETYVVPGRSEPLEPNPDGRGPLGAICTARLDPQTLQAGRPMALGAWGVRMQLRACGWRVNGPVSDSCFDTAALRDVGRLIAGPSRVVPGTDKRGRLTLAVRDPNLSTGGRRVQAGVRHRSITVAKAVRGRLRNWAQSRG